MNILTAIKRKMKNLKKHSGVVVPVAGTVVLAAGTASAAVDLTAISTAIATAITDITSAAVLLAGAYAGVWGIKQIVTLFRSK